MGTEEPFGEHAQEIVYDYCNYCYNAKLDEQPPEGYSENERFERGT